MEISQEQIESLTQKCAQDAVIFEKQIEEAALQANVYKQDLAIAQAQIQQMEASQKLDLQKVHDDQLANIEAIKRENSEIIADKNRV